MNSLMSGVWLTQPQLELIRAKPAGGRALGSWLQAPSPIRVGEVDQGSDWPGGGVAGGRGGGIEAPIRLVGHRNGCHSDQSLCSFPVVPVTWLLHVCIDI